MEPEKLGMELTQEQIMHLLAIKEKVDERVAMRKEAQKRYYQRNKAKITAYAKKYQEEHYVHKRQPNAVIVE